MEDLNPIQEAPDQPLNVVRRIRCSSLRVRNNVMLHGRPCQIDSLSRSRDNNEIQVVGIDILNGNRIPATLLAIDSVEVPAIGVKENLLLFCREDGLVTMMDDDGNIHEGVQVFNDALREELRGALEDELDIFGVVVQACGERVVVELKDVIYEEEDEGFME